MFKSVGLAIVSVTLCASVANAAAVYASNPVYAGQSGGSTVTCRVFNAANAAVTISARSLIDNTGASVTLTSSNCLSGPIAPGGSCSYSASSAGNLSFVCRLIVGGNPYITGIAEISKGGVYTTQPLVRDPRT